MVNGMQQGNIKVKVCLQKCTVLSNCMKCEVLETLYWISQLYGLEV